MNKKTIISNTVLFIFIIGFIIGFNILFGVENTLIGVSTVTAMLMLLERDLTIHPISNTFKLIGLNLLIGIGAFIADVNMWAGIPITFASMFLIGYTLSYNLRNPLYFPFILQYLFVLAFPVTLNMLPIRLASLVFGAIVIMLLQLLVNKRKLTKSGNKSIQEICSTLQVKIEEIQTGNLNRSPNDQISKEISSLRKMVFDRRADDFYLTEEGKIRLNISAALERINMMLETFTEEEADGEILTNLSRCLTLIGESLDDKTKVKKLSDTFNEIVAKYHGKQNISPMILKVLSNIDFLIGHVADLKGLKKEKYNLVKKVEQVPERYKKVTFGNRRHQTNSIKFSFAIRIAIGMSLSGFIVDLFEIHEGRWIMFTLLSLIIPIYERSHKRVRDRIFATIVGSIIVLIIFTIFEGTTVRTIILMLSGYLMTYIKVYRYSTIIVTFSAIGSATILSGTTEILTVNRVLLVVAGTLLALFLNKFVYAYQIDDANNDLKSMYQKTLDAMLIEVRELLQNKQSSDNIRNLFMTTTIIEDRVVLNLQSQDDQGNVDWLDQNRLLAMTLYEMFLWIEKHGASETTAAFMVAHSEALLETSTYRESLNAVNEQIKDTNDIENKILLSMMNEVFTDHAIG